MKCGVGLLGWMTLRVFFSGWVVPHLCCLVNAPCPCAGGIVHDNLLVCIGGTSMISGA